MASMSLVTSPKERPLRFDSMVTTRVRLSRLMMTGPVPFSSVTRSCTTIGPLGPETVSEPIEVTSERSVSCRRRRISRSLPLTE
ncbi:hypothetical protein D3C72_362550 [compost metagenome]